jgi:hypothetical protein
MYYILVGLAVIILAVVVIAKFFNIDLLQPSNYSGFIGETLRIHKDVMSTSVQTGEALIK